MTDTRRRANTRTRQEFVRLIRAEHERTIASIIRKGELFEQAAAQLKHGEYGKMFDLDENGNSEAGCSERSAHMYREIARHPIIANRKHASILPASWYTLYLLTRVKDKALERLIRDGKITQELERKQVRELVQWLLDQEEKYEDEYEVTEVDVGRRLDFLVCHLNDFAPDQQLAHDLLYGGYGLRIEGLVALHRWLQQLLQAAALAEQEHAAEQRQRAAAGLPVVVSEEWSDRPRLATSRRLG
jgi:hypothetical protein